MEIVDVTPDNASEEGFFCIKTSARPGFESKRSWFAERYAEGLRLKILRGDDGQQIAFIEYVPAENAWRPVSAPNYIFIHCISGYRKEHRGKGYASMLIAACEDDARAQGKDGVTVMTSDGPWTASMQVFVKNGYEVTDRRGRFELMARKFSDDACDPQLIGWEKSQAEYRGWHLLYADQCPWHDKAANDLLELANSEGIDLRITKITSAEQARRAPSGFGVFSLVHNGELIEDHYISKTRFSNILSKRHS